jgi:hypothetical protein
VACVLTEFQTREQFYAAIKRAQSGDKEALAEVRSFADNPRRRKQAIRTSVSGAKAVDAHRRAS